jgi:hypothetical protein
MFNGRSTLFTCLGIVDVLSKDGVAKVVVVVVIGQYRHPAALKRKSIITKPITPE